jgi:tRNA pseudouridine38-40 synthase
MTRYMIRFSYDGTRYHGWQIQPNGNSVQAELQRGISLLLRHEVNLTGAGRTDAGVHARCMAAHFDVDEEIDCAQLTYRLNRVLPRDIAVLSTEAVAPELHARFSAVARTYHYYVHTQRDPFLRHYSWLTPYELDFCLMNDAASCLLRYDDFGCFCKAGADVKTTICHISEACWIQDSEHCWHFRIVANRFLRNMVRAVVGTLVEVGRGRMTVGEFCRVVESGNRNNAGESMPAHALFLEDVSY